MRIVLILIIALLLSACASHTIQEPECINCIPDIANETYVQTIQEPPVVSDESVTLSINNPVTVKIAGKSHVIQVIGANSDTQTVILSVDGEPKTFIQGKSTMIQGIHMFVKNITYDKTVQTVLLTDYIPYEINIGFENEDLNLKIVMNGKTIVDTNLQEYSIAQNEQTIPEDAVFFINGLNTIFAYQLEAVAIDKGEYTARFRNLTTDSTFALKQGDSLHDLTIATLSVKENKLTFNRPTDAFIDCDTSSVQLTSDDNTYTATVDVSGDTYTLTRAKNNMLLEGDNIQTYGEARYAQKNLVLIETTSTNHARISYPALYTQ